MVRCSLQIPKELGIGEETSEDVTGLWVSCLISQGVVPTYMGGQDCVALGSSVSERAPSSPARREKMPVWQGEKPASVSLARLVVRKPV